MTFTSTCNLSVREDESILPDSDAAAGMEPRLDLASLQTSQEIEEGNAPSFRLGKTNFDQRMRFNDMWPKTLCALVKVENLEPVAGVISGEFTAAAAEGPLRGAREDGETVGTII